MPSSSGEQKNPATDHKLASWVAEGLGEEILSKRPSGPAIPRNLSRRLLALTGGPSSLHCASSLSVPAGVAVNFSWFW